MKRPSFQFYPADWRKDVELRSCSIAARGLWVEMMCLAHECDPYGHLTVNGRAMTPANIAGQVGLAPNQCSKLMQELLDNGVARRTDEGVIYSKRMVEDERARETRAEIGRQNGVKGKEFGALGAEHGGKGGRPKKTANPDENAGSEPGQKPPQNPHPSSSSSSSTSVSIQPSIEGLSPAEPPPCPHGRLLDLFAELVPELPQPRRELWSSSKGADAMRQRWKWLLSATRSTNGQRYATTADEGLDWFRRFFEQVAESDFLTGRSGAWAGCDLTWLMGKDNFAKVVQGNYINKTREAA
jgi:DNA-binding Lrp family transcriptional regulator